jgi:hypothetical protein
VEGQTEVCRLKDGHDELRGIAAPPDLPHQHCCLAQLLTRSLLPYACVLVAALLLVLVLDLWVGVGAGGA